MSTVQPVYRMVMMLRAVLSGMVVVEVASRLKAATQIGRESRNLTPQRHVTVGMSSNRTKLGNGYRDDIDRAGRLYRLVYEPG